MGHGKSDPENVGESGIQAVVCGVQHLFAFEYYGNCRVRYRYLEIIGADTGFLSKGTEYLHESAGD